MKSFEFFVKGSWSVRATSENEAKRIIVEKILAELEEDDLEPTAPASEAPPTLTASSHHKHSEPMTCHFCGETDQPEALTRKYCPCCESFY